MTRRIFDMAAIEKAHKLIKVINNVYRQDLMKLIDKAGKITGQDLIVKTGMYQSDVSRHLSLLRKANLVLTERDGHFIYYSLNYNAISEFNSIIHEFVKAK